MSGPAREYLRELPSSLSQIREDLAEAVHSARYLLPFVWRATMDAEVEQASATMFEQGRILERVMAEEAAGPRLD